MQQFLKGRQLDALRRLNERSMPDQVTVLVPGAATPDGYGQEALGFVDGPTVRCRFRSSTQRTDSAQGGRPANQEVFLFLVPVGTVLDVHYRLRRKGIDYEIVGEPTDGSHQLSKLVVARKL